MPAPILSNTSIDDAKSRFPSRSALSSPSSKSSSGLTSPTSRTAPPANPNLYKTKMCRSWETTGQCSYAAKCLFAHGPHELRPVPRQSSINAVIVGLQSGPLRYPLSPSRLSTPIIINTLTEKSFTSAGAPTAPRIWSDTDPKLSNEGKSGSPSSKSSKSSVDGERAARLFKTELCRTFSDLGTCPYGARCQFAHGDAELRSVERPKKYKTQKCQKFHTEGACPFGSRCIFIHDEDERELPHSDKYDPEYAKEQRLRRASLQGRLARQAAMSGLTGEFLKLRMAEAEPRPEPQPAYYAQQ
ncbi:C3H1-type domain-containing protein [Plasmodiophora brassicae]|uniref:C3H1-type domain-containing protein n=1 Tax=Plasmodiophora brassicae TaxID=37360 RepID=A0A0G4IIG6_PLABS|nr:hypothetical protein PBRA_003772 [Plasmodiophora brassicae]SPQ94290.1 unnamed protein product [Plasmodiophora brassicae]